MADKNSYKIVYDSDFIIDDLVELSTLCVFYDKVYLPYRGRLGIPFVRDILGFHPGDGHDDDLKNFLATQWSREIQWEADNKEFFDEEVITRVNCPSVHSEEIITWMNKLVTSEITDTKPGVFNKWDCLLSDPAGRHKMIDKLGWAAMHMSRGDLTLPCLKAYGHEPTNRETLKTLLAERAFRYVLPALSGLHPDQILEVRRKVADLREGFSMHLQMLTADIDAQLKGGESAEEIGRYAQNVIETKFEPQYVEFERQLGSIKLRSAGKILDVVGRVFEIDASMLSPKLYLDLFKLGRLLATGGAEELKDSLSNERQAYHFMHLVAGTEVGSK